MTTKTKRRRTNQPVPNLKTPSMEAAYRAGSRAQRTNADWIDAEERYQRRNNASDDDMKAWADGWADAADGRIGHAANCPLGITGVAYPDRPRSHDGHAHCRDTVHEALQAS